MYETEAVANSTMGTTPFLFKYTPDTPLLVLEEEPSTLLSNTREKGSGVTRPEQA